LIVKGQIRKLAAEYYPVAESDEGRTAMAALRWLALIVAALALVCRLAARRLPFDFGVVVTPQLHRGIPIGVVFFWAGLTISAVLIGISFLHRAH
jgi:hypothetical protein